MDTSGTMLFLTFLSVLALESSISRMINCPFDLALKKTIKTMKYEGVSKCATMLRFEAKEK